MLCNLCSMCVMRVATSKDGAVKAAPLSVILLNKFAFVCSVSESNLTIQINEGLHFLFRGQCWFENRLMVFPVLLRRDAAIAIIDIQNEQSRRQLEAKETISA